MKKILFTILLSLIIFMFQNPTQVKAGCFDNSGSCTVKVIKCDFRGTIYCCDTKKECDDFKKSQPICEEGAEIKIDTAIGCIPIETTDVFTGWILGWAIGVGGGIAFLLIIYASFMTMTSQGNPERLKAGQELLTSAISGLILLIFSVFILKFIGVDILNLDRWGFGK